MSNGVLNATGEYTPRWTLNGWYVETEGYVITTDSSNDFQIKSFMAYDPQKKDYGITPFLSTGLIMEAEATWNPETLTMTQKAQFGDFTQTTVSDFFEADLEKWTIVTRDANQNTVSEMNGVNTRRDR